MHLFHRTLAAFALLLAACGGSATEGTADTTAPTTERTDPMMVIRVVIDVNEDSVDEFVRYLQEESVAVRQLDGCVRYQLFRDPAQPTRFLLYEEWATEAAFDTYRNSDQLAQSFAVLGPMMAGPPDSQYFVASPAE